MSLRHCRWCRLLLDVNAPQGSENIIAPAGKVRRVQPHCDSPTCTWCDPCYQRRCDLSEHGLDPNTTDPDPAA